MVDSVQRGNNRQFWYIDIDDFYELMGVKYVDAEAAYHDTVVR